MARVSQPGRTRLSGSWGDFASFGIGNCGGLVGGARVTPPPCLRLFEPVALAVHFQNMDMIREAIEKRASETLAAEDGGPFLEWKIRRDDGRAAFVTLGVDIDPACEYPYVANNGAAFLLKSVADLSAADLTKACGGAPSQNPRRWRCDAGGPRPFSTAARASTWCGPSSWLSRLWEASSSASHCFAFAGFQPRRLEKLHALFSDFSNVDAQSIPLLSRKEPDAAEAAGVHRLCHDPAAAPMARPWRGRVSASQIHQRCDLARDHTLATQHDGAGAMPS